MGTAADTGAGTGQIGAVESVKAASDIYAPVSGEVTEVNDSLGDSPGLINESAESGGEPQSRRPSDLWTWQLTRPRRMVGQDQAL